MSILDSSQFQVALEHLSFLSHEQARSFVENGYVVVSNAFPEEVAEQVCNFAWQELESKHGIQRDNPSTWRELSNGYIRTAGGNVDVRMESEAPNALAAHADLVGGLDRLPHRGVHLRFTDGIISNFRTNNSKPSDPAKKRAPGWHKDGWHFRHFLDSPEQGLLVVPIYSEIRPQSGGTVIATDSIVPVARLLSTYRMGFHADSVQGGGYLIPYLVDQCSNFVELTGRPGDMAILHPFMLHRFNPNPTDRTRFIANYAVVLREPMCFSRAEDDHYSLAELVVLHALDTERYEFKTTRAREAFVPGPFRNEEEARRQRGLLLDEMRQMALNGLETPSWGSQYGYMSNAVA